MAKIDPDEFIGKIYKTNSSGDCFVIDVKSSYDMTVMFYDGYCTKVYKGNLDKGKVYNPYYRDNLFYGVGVFDRPKNEDKTSGTKIRTLWYNMLERCYCEKFHKKQPTYKGVEVSEDWKVFSKFEKDIREMLNFEKCLIDGWVLDKDILSIGNKVYSKETCCFIPKSLNSKLSSLPSLGIYGTGCTLLPYNRYRVCVSGYGDYGHIGCYSNLDEAFNVYKIFKGSRILEEIEKYSGIIDQRAVDSVVSYVFKYVPELKNGKNLVGVV